LSKVQKSQKSEFISDDFSENNHIVPQLFCQLRRELGMLVTGGTRDNELSGSANTTRFSFQIVIADLISDVS